MAQRIEGAVEITLHLEELQARLNPEWMGKAEYRIRVWLNGLERWQSEKPVKVSEGGAAAIGVAIPMRLEFDTDVIAIQVQAAWPTRWAAARWPPWARSRCSPT